MNFYSMEHYEMMGDILNEIADWEAYEKDMEQNPYDSHFPTDSEIENMFA